MKPKPIEDIKRTINELDGIQRAMEARRRVLSGQLDDLDDDIQRLSDSRGGLILHRERVHGIRPE